MKVEKSLYWPDGIKHLQVRQVKGGFPFLDSYRFSFYHRATVYALTGQTDYQPRKWPVTWDLIQCKHRWLPDSWEQRSVFSLCTTPEEVEEMLSRGPATYNRATILFLVDSRVCPESLLKKISLRHLYRLFYGEIEPKTLWLDRLARLVVENATIEFRILFQGLSSQNRFILEGMHELLVHNRVSTKEKRKALECWLGSAEGRQYLLRANPKTQMSFFAQKPELAATLSDKQLLAIYCSAIQAESIDLVKLLNKQAGDRLK